jgi:hypothetical protein
VTHTQHVSSRPRPLWCQCVRQRTGWPEVAQHRVGEEARKGRR